MPKKILIVSGEPSGDLHASNLVKNLKTLKPDLRFFGMGGRLSRQTGVDVIVDISGLALVGAVEVLKHIFTVKKAYQSVMAKIDSDRPDLAILVDYPGFNLRLAQELKKRSIPVVYYISPQIWAWGMDRINIIKKYVKKMVVLFKFEEELYKSYGIDAEFVGNPLLDSVKVTLREADTLKKYGLTDDSLVVALLPGSRELEVKTLLPIMMASAEIICAKLPDVKFIVVKHPDLAIKLYETALKNPSCYVNISNGDAYNIVNASRLAIVASGTATLESAIIGTPIIITYKANFITYLLYKIVARIRFLGLVNIIAGKEIVPEFLQYNATPEKIAAKAIEILTDERLRVTMREELRKVKLSLGEPGASHRAANVILPLI